MDRISFDPNSHTYTVDGKRVLSVTQLLSWVGLAPDYSKYKGAREAADRGSDAHQSVALALEDMREPNYRPNDDFMSRHPLCSVDHREMVEYATSLIRGEIIAVEKIYACSDFAGTIDCIYKDEEGAVIVDWKTGRQEPHHKAQVYLYSVLAEKERPMKLKLAYLKTRTVIDVDSDEIARECEALVEAVSGLFVARDNLKKKL